MKNCKLKNYISPYVISMHSMGEENPVYLTFQNVRTSTIVYDDKSAYNITNMNQCCDVDEVIARNRVSMMQSEEYELPMNQDFVTYYDNQESYEYMSSHR